MTDSEKSRKRQGFMARLMSFLAWDINRSLYVLVICAVLPTLAIGLHSGITLRQKALADVQGSLANLTSSIASLQLEKTTQAKTIAQTLAALPEVRSLDNGKCEPLFGKLLRDNPALANIVLMDSNGIVKVSAHPASAPFDLSDRTTFKDAVRTMEFSAGDFMRSRIVQVPVFQFSYPIIDDSGVLVGVLFVTFNLDKYNLFFNNLALPPDSRVVLLDRNSIRLLALAKDVKPAEVGKPIVADNWRTIAESKDLSGHFVGTRYDGAKVLFSYAKLQLRPGEPAYMTVLVNTPIDGALRDANLKFRENIILLILAAVLSLIIAKMLGRAIVGRQVEVLKESETRFRIVANQTYDWEYWRAPGGVFRWVSPSCERICGYKAEEFMANPGLTMRDIIHPDDVDAWDGHRHMSNGSDHQNCEIETRIINKTGEVVFVSHNCHPIFDEDGIFLGRRGSNRDITAKKMTQQTLKESEKSYRMLADNSGDVIWTVDNDLRLTYLSPSVKLLFGTEPEELTGSDSMHLVAPSSKPTVLAALEQRLRDECNGDYSGITRLEFEAIHKNGSQFWMEIVVRRLLDGQGLPLGFLGVSRDVTDRKKLIEELHKAVSEAEDANKAKSTFLANMSHEIRTPLNGMMGLLQLMRDTPLDEEQTDWVTAALQSGRRLTQLLSDILDLARVEAGKILVQANEFALIDVKQSVLDLFSVGANEKGVELDFTIDEGLPQILVGDEVRLRQILFNLVGNAVKFTQAGSVHIQATPIKCKPEELIRVLVTISDTGIGIPEELQEKVFEPFTQAEGDYTRRFQGAGLGLSIVHRLVELLGGSIYIQSSIGIGTTVYVSLPYILPYIQPGAVNSAPDAAIPTQKEEAQSNESLRVLLAEDDEVSQKTCERMMQKFGHRVVTARDGQEALQRLAEQDFDLILMDPDACHGRC